jgi:hypothetical protein
LSLPHAALSHECRIIISSLFMRCVEQMPAAPCPITRLPYRL